MSIDQYQHTFWSDLYEYVVDSNTNFYTTVESNVDLLTVHGRESNVDLLTVHVERVMLIYWQCTRAVL